jgi:hypothetical protein
MTGKWPARYGDRFVGGEIVERTTIHGSGTVDIQISAETGEIVAVWFRCLPLPYRVSTIHGPPQGQPGIAITAVEYLEP